VTKEALSSACTSILVPVIPSRPATAEHSRNLKLKPVAINRRAVSEQQHSPL
jgi:hypothetical protein